MKTRNLNSERASSRRRYHKLVESGLCCCCGKAPATAGRRCPPCREANRRASREHAAKRRKAWLGLGVCVCCGQREAMPWRTQCAVCAEARDECHERVRANRRAA